MVGCSARQVIGQSEVDSRVACPVPSTIMKPLKGAAVGLSGRRTVKVGAVTVVACRNTGTVTVGQQSYSTTDAKKLAASNPSDPLNVKVLEQAQWAEGRDL